MADLTHLSLFSGIGGLDLAAEAADFQTIGQCEWADYPTKVLEKHWPDIPRWRDIQTLTGDDFYARTGRRSVTVISGGFPCQPFSVAGKRRGKEDDRYLWPEMCRTISEIRPAWVIGENVPGIINLALDTVLSDLEGQGYACQTFIIPACGVDAPHRRERIAIVARRNRDNQKSASNEFVENACCGGRIESEDVQKQQGGTKLIGRSNAIPNAKHERCDGRSNNITGRPVRGWTKRLDSEDQPYGDERECGSCKGSQNVAYANKQGLQGWERGELQECSCEWTTGKSNTLIPDTDPQQRERSRGARNQRPESSNGGWWSTEPDVGRVANGIPSRVDRLKCLGNAVVPQQFYPFFKYIAEIERADV